ncbi:MAG: ATPase [Deltaproteobacteria bacterium]|nr:MAG: ATPase [Deltaproteobacteria bacterium]
MIERRILPELRLRLAENPAVVVLGPRQCGKTTLALALAAERNALYLDLESPRDRAKLADPELYLPDKLDRLVILDEVHRAPSLFPALRGLIDGARREGRRSGLYLLLGSAALELLKQSGETLAGRVSFMELAPFDLLEFDAPGAQGAGAADRLWLRGGFPESYLASSDGHSARWRRDFIRTYLERDIPAFGPRIAAETLRRFWTMLAHLQGSLLNSASLARSLGVDTKTVGSYLDLLVDLLLLRRLPAWHANLKKRLVKSPKVYIRDSGLLHSLLAIEDREILLGHPVVGASWECFVIEQLLNVAPEGVQGFHYRTSGGAEVDLLLRFGDGRLWAVEVKRSLTPKVTRGFHSACKDLEPDRRLVVYPGTESYPLREQIEVVPLGPLCAQLAEAR